MKGNVGLVDQLRGEEARLLGELEAIVGAERARAVGSLQLTRLRPGLYLKRVHRADTPSGMSSKSLGHARNYGGEARARGIVATDKRLREVRAMLKLIERGVLPGGSVP